MVCKWNDSIETVVQSESTPDRAQYSVDVLNEHEVLNNRSPNYYWRLRKVSETDETVRRSWRKENTRRQFESYEKYRAIPSDLRLTA